MPTYTSHYNLKKPTPGNHEPFDIDDQNGNMDKLDAAIWKLPATYKRSLTASDNLDSLSEDGVYYITNVMPLNVPTGPDIAYSLLYQVSSSVIKHQYIIKPYTGLVIAREYSGTPAWQEWRIASTRWTQITGVTENTEFQIPTMYNEVYIEAAFSAGQRLCFQLKDGTRQDSGFYYNSSACAGGAVSFAGNKKLMIYHPYYGGTQTTYSTIKVWAR